MGDKRPGLDRRQVLKLVMIGGVATAVAMPGKWVKPVVNAVIPPAHAAASAPATTKAPGTTGTTTTAGPTTTTPAPTTTAKTATGTTLAPGYQGPIVNNYCTTAANNSGYKGNWYGMVDPKGAGDVICTNSGGSEVFDLPPLQ
jgi:hypothetical protein